MTRARKVLANAVAADKIAGGQELLPTEVVKSAGRALQILELFDILHRESCVVEISELLGFPQSSTSMLLRSLVSMGYLHHNPLSRTYKPTMRVALLGTWVDQGVIEDGDLLLLMKRLNQETGMAVVLAARSGLFARYIHVIQATVTARLYVVQGSMRSLTRSGVGYAMLSQMPDPDVRRIAVRINAEAKAEVERTHICELMQEIESVRRKGYALTTNLVTLGAGMLAIPLPDLRDGSAPLVIGLGGMSENLREHEADFAKILQQAIERYKQRPLGQVSAGLRSVSTLTA